MYVVSFFFFLMIRRPPRSTRTDTRFPYTTLFRSVHVFPPISSHDACVRWHWQRETPSFAPLVLQMTSWQQVRKSIDQPRSDVTGGSRGINQTKAIRFLFRIGSESICHLSMKLPIPRTKTVKCIAITRRCTLFRVFFGKHEHKRRSETQQSSSH